jgi:hypothetical protein
MAIIEYSQSGEHDDGNDVFRYFSVLLGNGSQIRPEAGLQGDPFRQPIIAVQPVLAVGVAGRPSLLKDLRSIVSFSGLFIFQLPEMIS